MFTIMYKINYIHRSFIADCTLQQLQKFTFPTGVYLRKILVTFAILLTVQ